MTDHNRVRNDPKGDGLLALAIQISQGKGGIEALEKVGQNSLVQSTQLPTEGTPGHPQYGRSQDEEEERLFVEGWAATGIEFGEVPEDDPVFRDVKLPLGWKKVATGHDMWSDLVDGNGRKRASIFYKAAFYDRSAHIHLNTRFRVLRNHFEGGADRRIQFNALDGDAVMYWTEVYDPGPEPDRGAHGWRGWDDAVRVIEEEEHAKCLAWLEKRYPKWHEPGQYWDV